MSRTRFLIFLIACAIVIQNTCPYGWASKTAFMSPHECGCHQCPVKDHKQTKSGQQNDVRKNYSQSKHIYVININKAVNAIESLAFVDQPISLKPEEFKVIFLKPPFRPPNIFSLV